ncbi:MAG: tetratricopeptide repeat protein [Egibacteraceae bacterium]
MLEGRREALGDEHPDTLASMHDLGQTLAERDAARRLYEQVLATRRDRLGDDPLRLATRHNLAATLADLGQLKATHEASARCWPTGRACSARAPRHAHDEEQPGDHVGTD